MKAIRLIKEKAQNAGIGKNHGEVHSSYFIHQEMETWVFNAQNDTDNTISELFSMKVLMIYEPGTIFNV